MPCERLLYVMRHGLTNWNQSRRIQGHLDPPLNATGRAQARLAGLRLARAGAAALYSSDLQRAWETARLVGRATGLQVVQNVGLREINFGIWQGLSSQEIRQRYPAVYAARRDNPYDVAPAGAETWRRFYDRAVQTVNEILASVQSGPVVLVTHSGVCTVLGLRAQVWIVPAGALSNPTIAAFTLSRSPAKAGARCALMTRLILFRPPDG